MGEKVNNMLMLVHSICIHNQLPVSLVQHKEWKHEAIAKLSVFKGNKIYLPAPKAKDNKLAPGLVKAVRDSKMIIIKNVPEQGSKCFLLGHFIGSFLNQTLNFNVKNKKQIFPQTQSPLTLCDILQAQIFF